MASFGWLLAVAIGSLPANAQSSAYVPNGGDNTVSVINTATNSVVATVSVPGCGFGIDGPGISITPNGAFVFVTQSCGQMSVINTSNNTVVATFSATGTTGPGPNLQFTAFTPNGAFGYVASAGFNYVALHENS
jgi:YVTN family beta-propeller protein